MNRLEDLLFRYQLKLQHENLTFRPDIPITPLMASLSKYTYGVHPDEVIVHVDTSETSNGKNGSVITTSAIYTCSFSRGTHYAKDIASIEKVEVKDRGIALNGKPFIEHIWGGTAETFVEFIRELISIVREPDILSLEVEDAEKSHDSIESIFNFYLPKMSKKSCFLSPNIPQKKLDNAIKSYAQEIGPEKVKFLYDATVFGSSKKGFLLSDDSLYLNGLGNKALRIRWDEIKSARIQERGKIVINEEHILIFIIPKNLWLFARMLRDIAWLYNPEGSNSMGPPLVRSLFSIEGDYRTCDGIDQIKKKHSKELPAHMFYFKPDIPDKKLTGALTSYAKDIRPSEVLMLYDETIAGTGKRGMIITIDSIYAGGKDWAAPAIKLSDLDSVALKNTLMGATQMTLNGKSVIDLALKEDNAQKFNDLLKDIGTLTSHQNIDFLSNETQASNFKSIEEIIEFYLPKLAGNAAFVAPDIPDKKMNNALSSYAPLIAPEEVLFLYDSSLLKSGKEGILITKNAIYLSGSDCRYVRIRLQDIAFIRDTGFGILAINGRFKITFLFWTEQMRLFTEFLREIGKIQYPYKPSLINLDECVCPKCKSADLGSEKTVLEKTTGYAVGGLIGAGFATVLGVGQIAGEGMTYAGAKKGASGPGSLLVCKSCGFKWKM